MNDLKTCFEPILEKQLKGHKNEITSVYFSPNEQQIATGSLDNSVLLWDLRGTMRSYRFQGHDEAVMDVTFSTSGKYMASASRDKTVRLWVPTVTGSTGTFKAHSQTVRSVQFSPDSSKILTSSDDKTVKLWSSDKNKFLASFVGHTNWVRCARMSNDGSVIASCSDDKTTKLWNPASNECVHTYKDQKGHAMFLAWHPSGCYIAVGTSQGNVKLYDIRTHTLVQYYSVHNDAVTQIAFHPSGSYIITASKDGKIKILDLLEGHPVFTLSGHSGAVNTVNFSPNGEYFSSAGSDKLVFVWKTNFTELFSDKKENLEHNIHKSSSQSNILKGKTQERSVWYLCYHNTMYPVTTFVHYDDSQSPRGPVRMQIYLDDPLANSTMVEHRNTSPRFTPISHPSLEKSNFSKSPLLENNLDPSLDVGHRSHIPLQPPSPSTYSIPSIMNKTNKIIENESMYGMIKLNATDVCYTSGTIEWVGRKRSFPINTGFKLVKGNNIPFKKSKFENTFSLGNNDFKECDCGDVLPTMNAIVDHLNALHEAVDLVDIRINAIEGIVGKN